MLGLQRMPEIRRALAVLAREQSGGSEKMKEKKAKDVDPFEGLDILILPDRKRGEPKGRRRFKTGSGESFGSPKVVVL